MPGVSGNPGGRPKGLSRRVRELVGDNGEAVADFMFTVLSDEKERTRDQRVKLPLSEPDEVEPPHADHVEAAAWLLAPDYLIGLLALDATGARVGEVAAATIGDLDETRKAWLVRAKVAKTRRARWVELPDDLFDVIVGRLPAREDRDPDAALFPIGSTDRLRMAIGRACRDGGVPVCSARTT